MAGARIDSLTGVRFLVAFGILLHHFGGELSHRAVWIARFLESLSSCVSFFFVLSGFILVHSSDATRRVPTWRRFMVSRLARVYPLYLVGLLVMSVPFVKYGGPYPDWAWWETPISILLSALGIQAWVPRYSSLINGPGWSLSAEIFFYASFPVVVSWGRGLLFRKPVVAIALLWAAATGLGVWMELTILGDRSLMDDGARFAGFHPLVRFPEFLMGMALGALHAKRPASPIAATGIWIGASLFLLACLFLGSEGIWRTAFHNSLLSPLYCAVIFGLASARDGIQRLLCHRWFSLLGESSYALYILHFPFMVALSSMIHRAKLPLEGVPKLVAYLFLSIGLSVLAHLWIERPARVWIRDRFSREEAAGR